MRSILLQNVRICMEDGRLIIGSLRLSDGVIAEIIEDNRNDIRGDWEVIDGSHGIVFPGFIDIHIHGAAGSDIMDKNPESISTVARALPAEGTTSFLATTMTQSTDTIVSAIKNISSYMDKQKNDAAQLLGIHLEGPYIHPNQAGAQPVEFIVKPSITSFKKLTKDSLRLLKIITLAPELDKEFTFVKYLKEHGIIISSGHTSANHEEMTEAVNNGVTHLTHLCNAMDGIKHRGAMGPVGSAILDKRLFVEVIADGVHISSEMMKIIYECVGPERIMLITDAMRAKGLADGNYSLGGQDVIVSNGRATLKDGTLAGSVLRFSEGLRIFKEATGASVFELKEISSSVAARRLGLWDRKGSIEIGKDADLVVVDDSFEVQFTFIMGKLVFNRSIGKGLLS